MTSAKFEHLQSELISVNALINTGLYEKALDKLYLLEKETVNFSGSHLTSSVRSYISYCLIKLDRVLESILEKELFAEETARLGDFDEAGDTYKEIGDTLKLGGKIDKSRAYYLLAKKSYETWVNTNRQIEPSPPEAWLAWSLVCKGEASNSWAQKATAYLEAARKFDEAKKARKDNKMLISFYESRFFFLMGRAALLLSIESTPDDQKSKIYQARHFFEQAIEADKKWKLAMACEKIVGAILSYSPREEKTIQLMNTAKADLDMIEKRVTGEKLRELIDNYLNGTVKDISSFCINFEQSVIL